MITLLENASGPTRPEQPLPPRNLECQSDLLQHRNDELDRKRHRVAATPGGGKTPARRGIDSSRRGPEHGVRGAASGDQPPARNTRPDRATRFIETAFGILSYSELAPILTERLRREGRLRDRFCPPQQGQSDRRRYLPASIETPHGSEGEASHAKTTPRHRAGGIGGGKMKSDQSTPVHCLPLDDSLAKHDRICFGAGERLTHRDLEQASVLFSAN